MPSIALSLSLRGQLLSGSRFNPISLFSAGEQGIWLDPSDLSTMFSDRAGTTPVTTPGQTVGLRLDKSKGLVLGSELVDTANTAAAWVIYGTNTVSQDGDAVRVNFVDNAVGAYLFLNQSGGLNANLVAGKTYQLQVQLRINSGSANFAIYATALGNYIDGQNITDTAYVTRAFTFQYVSGSPYIQFANLSAGESIWIRNISVRELPGNHAVAPTDAARPTYGIEPKTGRRNLLLATDTMATQSLTVAAVAHTLAFTGTGTITLTGASTAGPLVGTGASNRVSLTFTPTAASLTLTVVGSVTLAQLELGSTATAYQRVGTDFDVTEAGVATVHYVQYDGTDDSFSTSSIDFSATDKMSVFAGVRKIADTNSGVIVDNITGSTDGQFQLLSGFSVAGRYAFVSKGSVQIVVEGSGYTSPITNVLTGLGDISGDRATIRVNGTQVAQSTADQGTGNYGNYPLYIGRRGGTMFPFNGRDYGIIIVGKTASATEITNTESYLAANTSGVTL